MRHILTWSMPSTVAVDLQRKQKIELVSEDVADLLAKFHEIVHELTGDHTMIQIRVAGSRCACCTSSGSSYAIEACLQARPVER
jgi:hypothetical protein